MPNKENVLNSVLVWITWEYYVAAELSKRWIIASLTLKNTKGVDIICSNYERTETINIQVKTNKWSNRNWILNKKVENEIKNFNLFYIFVNLNNNIKSPDYFIVPCVEVSKYCKDNHLKWLNTKWKLWQNHNNTNMRKFEDSEEKYLEKWELLNI